ncbi:ras association domain-containing protein 8-like [Scleropages formosus]|uniref:Ras association domain-containing protein 8-like n=1 Tax=Scleropages formosus TaxID=113540 RepID=A0A0P7XJ57_SCLFO|nr:ras association domain-containing protein 8-like [Scleropages formosus]
MLRNREGGTERKREGEKDTPTWRGGGVRRVSGVRPGGAVEIEQVRESGRLISLASRQFICKPLTRRPHSRDARDLLSGTYPPVPLKGETGASSKRTFQQQVLSLPCFFGKNGDHVGQRRPMTRVGPVPCGGDILQSLESLLLDMELKVWVDGVVRVVCGLSEETSCQDVVIALAQAIGQTGRYVLIQKLRDTERQLLADEKPLESLVKLGQQGNEVQFFLRRTGPSSSEALNTERGPVLPRPSEPEPPKRREPRKAHTFNLGPSSSPQSKVKNFKKSPRDSSEMRASPCLPGPTPGPAFSAGLSKEDLFRLILQQQEQLRELEMQLTTVEGEVVRKNHAELGREAALEEELRAEGERERGLRRHLAELRTSMDDCNRRLHDCATRSAHLEREIQQESRRTKSRPGPAQAGPEESLGMVRAKLQSQQRQGAELEASLSETEQALGKADALLKERNEEMDELNKEIRQCNLQQFIQQTGVPPVPSSSPSHPEQLEGYSNSGPVQYTTESPPRPTAKHFLGNPRNLQNPLVSSLNPEVTVSGINLPASDTGGFRFTLRHNKQQQQRGCVCSQGLQVTQLRDSLII